MPSILLSDNGVSSGSAGIKTSGSNDGTLALQTTTAAGTATTAVSIDTSQNVSLPNSLSTINTFGFKNRIINGAMLIDQRNAGASVNNTTTDAFSCDRFVFSGTSAAKFRVSQSFPGATLAGFAQALQMYSLAATSVAAGNYYYVAQRIEGFNTADLNWGTSSAQTVTLSFWVYSSLTGTFGGAITNAALDRSYPFSYTINAANTWEKKTITIAGDTTGTWVGATNGTGMNVYFSMGTGSTYTGTANAWATGLYLAPTGSTNFVSTNAATMYLTGVQLEKGSQATSFDFRPYTTELQLCQRYCYKNLSGNFAGYQSGTANLEATIPIPVSMRATPSASGTAGVFAWLYNGNQYQSSVTPTVSAAYSNQLNMTFGGFSGFSNGYLASGNLGLGVTFSAEL